MIKLPENKTFTVYEDKWVHGGNLNREAGPDENLSKLYNDQGNSCCVGHFLRDCGVNLEDVKGVGYASSVLCNVPIYWSDALDAHHIYKINDYKNLTLENRKILLQDAFKKAFDIDIVFKPTSPKE